MSLDRAASKVLEGVELVSSASFNSVLCLALLLHFSSVRNVAKCCVSSGKAKIPIGRAHGGHCIYVHFYSQPLLKVREKP